MLTSLHIALDKNVCSLCRNHLLVNYLLLPTANIMGMVFSWTRMGRYLWKTIAGSVTSLIDL